MLRRNAYHVVTILVLSACTGSADTPRATSPPSPFAGRTIIDLTHVIDAQAPYWPGPTASPFTHDTLIAHPDGRPAMAAYGMPEHFGTHIDAPVHSAQGQSSVDEIPVAQLFGPAVILDVTTSVAGDRDYAVSPADLDAWESRHGSIPEGAIVLARTGWSQRWNDADDYYPVDDEGRLHFPGFGPEVARILVEERRIAGIGIDSGSVDPGAADGFPVHGMVNGAGGFHLENLASLDALPEAGAFLIVAPIKIRGGSGGQVRVFAIVP